MSSDSGTGAAAGADITALAALVEPARRALYAFVVAQPAAVSREEAAAGVDVAHHIAKFHLDRLVDEGLLEVEYRRPPGRSGPGAGRPAKYYRRSSRQLDVSVPARRYELAGHLLAEAVSASLDGDVPVAEALDNAAAGVGHQWAGDVVGEAAAARADAGSGSGRATKAQLTDALVGILQSRGYEPRVDATGVTLGNCPFHTLATEHTELVCGMNLSLLAAMTDDVAAAGRARFAAVLDPAPGRCCVRILTKP